MNLKKNFCSVLAAVLLLSALAGCGGTAETGVVYDTDTAAVSVQTQSLAENDRFTLSWNDEAKCVILECKDTGKHWSTVPYDYLLEGGSSASMNSPLDLRVAKASSLDLEEVRGYTGAVEGGRVFSELVKNGIRVTYCFDEYRISIPVEYLLQENGISVTINGKGIIEDGNEWVLLSVSLSPYLCAADNDSEGAYLFVPSGSGALMYAKETAEKTRTFSGEVYGADASRILQEKLTDEEAIRLPVFGTKDGDAALLGIIAEGSVTAEIEAEAGNSRTGYSHVWPTFYFRGYDIIPPSTKSTHVGAPDVTRVSDALVRRNATVLYIPLTGEDADYVGMAKAYRSYLQDAGLLAKTEQSQNPYSVTLLGGVPEQTSFMGVPYQTVKPLTTFAQAQQIVSELRKDFPAAPVLRLQGYGDNGIDPGKVGGGFSFCSTLGNEAQQKELESLCAQTGTTVFTDFDLIRYSRSGNGFGFESSAAKTAILKKADLYPLSVPLRSFDEKHAYRLLGRDKLSAAAEKLLAMLKKKTISGVSLGSLSSIAYSDFTQERTSSKGDMETDVRKLIDQVRTADHSVAGAAANAYGACAADVLFDTPVDNGGYLAFDEQIPFYQIVFRGSRPLYSEPVNLAANMERQVVLALSGGTGIGFMLSADYDAAYAVGDTLGLYGTVYEYNKEKIREVLERYAETYAAIGDAAIDDYTFLPNGVSVTVFDNGVTLYANHINEKCESPVGMLDGYTVKTVG